ENPPELDLPVRPLSEASGTYDAAIATWWATALALWRVPAQRRVLFMQSLEQRFYPDWSTFDRLGAAAVLGLPLDFVVIARWMEELLAELRPGARCEVVRNGVDKRIFRPADRATDDGPLRVLVEGHPGLWFKGVREAVEAVRAMTEQATVTLVASDPAAAGELGADRVVGGLDAPGMATVYAEHDLLLKLSRVEGLPLPPLEAMHVGLPALVTPHTGHEEYMSHGQNGLVVGFDDTAAVTAWLDRLARERELLEKLRQGALARAKSWPSAERAGDEFVAAIRDICAAPPPDPADAAARLAADLELGLALGRHRALLAGWSDADVAALRAQIDQLGARLERITGSRLYRVASAARRLARRVRG
ncbi:MAG: glycosyltransferase family 4 protein, partial [Thermoleophilaceae bacterium]